MMEFFGILGKHSHLFGRPALALSKSNALGIWPRKTVALTVGRKLPPVLGFNPDFGLSSFSHVANLRFLGKLPQLGFMPFASTLSLFAFF